jgi:multidrug efflux system membrane fusion protein
MTGPQDVNGLNAPRGFFRRRTLVFLVLAILFVALILFVRQLQNKQANGPPSGHGRGRGGQDIAVAVGTATVVNGDIQIRIPALGTVTPLATVTVRTQITGQLQKIAFTEGQIVHAGDFLAQIDPRPYEAALLEAKGNLRRDQALLANAKLDLQRYEGMIKEDAVAQQQVDTQRALVDQYEGVVEADQGQIKSAEVNLQYTRIVAPIGGRVGLRQVDQGNYVTPGDANGIVVLNQLQPITVLFTIPEDNVPAIAALLQARRILKVEAYDKANNGKLADGRLLTLDNAIDTTTGTIKLRALFENKDGALFANQFVNVSLLQDTLHDQKIMPNSAVHRGAPNGVVTNFVYLVNPDSTVSVRTVTLGVLDGERVAVLDGLQPGDVVVTEGGDRLRDGAPVVLPNAKPADGAGPKAPDKRPPGAKGSGHKRSRPSS